MIRKVTMAAFALAALGLAPGCENQRRSEQQKLEQEKQELSQAQQEAPQQAQQETAEARQEAQEKSAQAQQEAQQESQQAQQEAQEKIASEQRDVGEAQGEAAESQQEAQQELTEAQRQEQQAQQEAIGGSGAAAVGTAQTAMGSVSKASSNELTLEPQAGGEPIKLSVDQNTRVTKDGQASSLDQIKEGDEVRASYQQQGGKNVATEVTVQKSGAGTGGSGVQDDVETQGQETWEGTKEGARELEHDVTQ